MEAALAVKPENRPQSIAEFVELFGWNEAAAPLPLDAPAPVTVAPLPPRRRQPRHRSPPILSGCRRRHRRGRRTTLHPKPLRSPSPRCN